MAKTGIKLRAFTGDGGISTVKAILFHPMETGMRKEKDSGQVVPAHYITEATVEHNGKTVLTCLWGPGISKNPFLSFDLKGSKAGDAIKVSWIDNQGGSDSEEAKIS